VRNQFVPERAECDAPNCLESESVSLLFRKNWASVNLVSKEEASQLTNDNPDGIDYHFCPSHAEQGLHDVLTALQANENPIPTRRRGIKKEEA
jgi:hypothetical protein